VPAPGSAEGSERELGTGYHDKLLALLPHDPPKYEMHRSVSDENELTQDVREAYERGLAPSAEVLEKTFGYIREARTLTHADSITYLIGRGSLLGLPTCTGIKITEHPKPPPPPRFVPGQTQFPGPPPNLKPTIETVTIAPCTPNKYTATEPGTLHTPLPRRAGETPRPLVTPSPSPRP
jgi:hypothetical protein